MSDPRNIKTYGAVGNGTNNDSNAVSRALDYVIQNGGNIYVPPGKYRLNSAVVKNITGPSVNIGIQGEGPGASEFIVPSSNWEGGILIDVSKTNDLQDRGLFRDFSIRVEGTAQIGLRFLQRITPRGAVDSNSVVAENIRIYSHDIANGRSHFKTAFDFSGAWRPILSKLGWFGPIQYGSNRFADNMVWDHPALLSDNGIKLHGCYDPVIHSCWIKGTKQAIDLTDTFGGNESEAARINDCVFNQVNYGVYWKRSSREPLFTLHNTHINYRIHGVHLEGARQLHITNCLFYNEDKNRGYSGVPRDIYLPNAEDFVIANNVFSFPLSNRYRIGIQVGDSGGATGKGIISNNIFNGKFWWMIWNNGRVSNVAGSNLYSGTFHTGGGRINGGANNINLPDVRNNP